MSTSQTRRVSVARLPTHTSRRRLSPSPVLVAAFRGHGCSRRGSFSPADDVTVCGSEREGIPRRRVAFSANYIAFSRTTFTQTGVPSACPQQSHRQYQALLLGCKSHLLKEKLNQLFARRFSARSVFLSAYTMKTREKECCGGCMLA